MTTWDGFRAIDQYVCGVCEGEGMYEREPIRLKNFPAEWDDQGQFEVRPDDTDDGFYDKVVYVEPSGAEHDWETGLRDADECCDYYQSLLEDARVDATKCYRCKGTGLDPRFASALRAPMTPRQWDQHLEDLRSEEEDRAIYRMENMHDPGLIYDMTHESDPYDYVDEYGYSY